MSTDLTRNVFIVNRLERSMTIDAVARGRVGRSAHGALLKAGHREQRGQARAPDVTPASGTRNAASPAKSGKTSRERQGSSEADPSRIK
jgi:hypothetical protein